MLTPLYWIPEIPYRLATMSRPRGGEWLEEEMRFLADQGIDVVVSLLTPEEARELGLENEAVQCEACGLRFINLPISDRGVPDDHNRVRHIIADLAQDLRESLGVAIHCRAGIGRSSLLAACIMHELGTPAAEAFRLIESARGCPVPDTDHQHEWVTQFVQQPHRASGTARG